MNKRFLAGVFALAMVLGTAAAPVSEAGLAPAFAISASAETYRDYDYTLKTDGTVRIDKYSGSAEAVEIPEKIGGRTVTEIAGEAFYGSSITSVVIPEGVTSIGALAFARCSSLTSVDIAETNKSYVAIDSVIYTKDMKTLVLVPATRTSYKIPATVTKIDGAFNYCTELTDIYIPKTVTDLGVSTFRGCKSLKKLTIPESITKIPNSMCMYCSALEEVTIPEKVTDIGRDAFYDCVMLEKVTVPDGVKNIGDCAFGYYNDGEGDTLIPGFKLRCHSGTAAEAYAKKNKIGIEYIAVSLEKARIEVPDVVYNGKAQKPALKVTLNGKTLKKDTDYTITYKNNKEMGKADIYVNGINAYSGTCKGYFIIFPKKVKTLKLKALGGRQLKANWNKYSKVTGYELQVSRSRNFTSATRKADIKKAATNNRTMKNFKGGYYYYARIRSYITVGKVRYYGAWSDTASVVCKW